MTGLQAGSATDVGRVRSNNQDQLLVADELFAVADGMGGHAAGEVASLTAVEALRASYHQVEGSEGLVAAARQANRSIFERARGNPELHGMGTTLVAIALVNEDDEERLAVVNVGDSRAYLLRQGELEQLTTDHSLVQELVDDGQLTEQEAAIHPQRHVLTRALGVDTDVNVDLLEVLPLQGDRYLLCSDGLVRELNDPQIASILRRLSDPRDAARELVATANERGGNDNITVVIVDVVDDGNQAASASQALETDKTVRRPTPVPAASAFGAATAGATVGAQRGGDSGAGTAGDARSDDPTLTTSFGAIGGYRPTTTAPPAEAGKGAGAGWKGQIGPPARAPLAEPPKRQAVTARVIGFVALLVVLLGGAALAVAWYARSSYFVGVSKADQITIYQGRPGGLLWFQPTVVDRTNATTSQVLPSRLSDLRSGKEEPSLSQARAYVTSLLNEKSAAEQTAPTTTLPGPPTTTLTPPSAVSTIPPP